LKKSFLVMIFLLSFLLETSPTRATSLCYNVRQMTAEQWLRLHSELMVITVSCGQNSSGESLVPLYQNFTQENIASLQKAEATLMKFYKDHYGGNGLQALDKLRTRLGNEYGLKVAELSTPRYCQQFQDKVESIYHLTPTQLNIVVQRMTHNEKSEFYLCPKQQPDIAKTRQ